MLDKEDTNIAGQNYDQDADETQRHNIDDPKTIQGKATTFEPPDLYTFHLHESLSLEITSRNTMDKATDLPSKKSDAHLYQSPDSSSDTSNQIEGDGPKNDSTCYEC